MSSRKRSRDEEDVQIRTAAGEPLAADSFVLRALSTCARALPADAAVWDVSGLLYDGQPFTRETVACWLQCCCSSIHGTAELDCDSISMISTVTGLAQVLAFAHAVGSFVGMLQAACSQLQQLKVVLQLPEQVLELPVASYMYVFGIKTANRLVRFNIQETGYCGATLATVEQRSHVQQQVAKQLAALLQLAHVLHLQPLLNLLHQFLMLNADMPRETGLLSGVMGLVFSDAVFEAALGSSTLSKEAYVSSVLSQPCSLSPIGDSSLLKPVGVPTYKADTKVLVFDAELRQDFVGAKAGVKVKVTLDLFGAGQARLDLQTGEGPTFVDLPARLLLGRCYPDAAALEALLTVTPPAVTPPA